MTVTGRGGDAGGEWIGDEGWTDRHGHLERVPDFGIVTYSHCRIDRARLDTPLIAPQNRASIYALQITTGQRFNRGHAFRTRFRQS